MKRMQRTRAQLKVLRNKMKKLRKRMRRIIAKLERPDAERRDLRKLLKKIERANASGEKRRTELVALIASAQPPKKRVKRPPKWEMTRSRSVEIRPTQHQKELLRTAFDACRHVYNKTVEAVNSRACARNRKAMWRMSVNDEVWKRTCTGVRQPHEPAVLGMVPVLRAPVRADARFDREGGRKHSHSSKRRSFFLNNRFSPHLGIDFALRVDSALVSSYSMVWISSCCASSI